MNSNSIFEIKTDLLRTNKAVVAIGCSFVQGAELEFDAPHAHDKGLYKNSKSFVNVLCEQYLEGTYTPINFGQEGGGNFAAISRLFLYDISWHTLDDIIVIFMPTGLQRFDIINDDSGTVVGQEFKTLYPYTTSSSFNVEHVVNLNLGYEKMCSSEKFEVMNCILNFQFLNSWIKEHNAKLIIFPAFSNEYTKSYFLTALNTNIFRDHRTHLRIDKGRIAKSFDFDFLINQVPWDKFITVNDSNHFFDLCFKNDKNYKSKYSMQQVIDKKLINDHEWILPRGHPSKKGHMVLAKELFNRINQLR